MAACGKDERAVPPREPSADEAVRSLVRSNMAPWLAAPADPLQVRVTDATPARSAEREIGVGGGEIRMQAGAHRLTLEVPPDALTSSQEITIKQVSVAGLPFEQGATLAVRIEPEGAVVRRPLVLRVLPDRAAHETRFTGFAIRNGELSLHPAAHGQDRPGRHGRSEVRMVLGTLGTFGIAIASPGEVAAAARHVPADLLSRLEQRVVLAFALPAQSSSLTTSVAFLQIAPQPPSAAPAPSAWLQGLLESIRDTYNDVVLPGFETLPKDDCLSPALWKAIADYVRWDALNQLLLPVQADPDLMENLAYKEVHARLVSERYRMLRERGFTHEQIEEINREIEKYRENFEEFADRITQKILEELKRSFHNVHRCCMTQKPLQYHVDTMVRILRAAALFGQENLVEDPWTAIRECACRVASAAKGAPEGFLGTITQTETLSIEETKTSEGGPGQMQRTTRRKRELSYAMTIHLLRPLGRHGMYGETSVRGTDEHLSLTSDNYGVCTVEAETQTAGEGRAEDAQAVNLHLRPDERTFSVSFNSIAAEGTANVRRRREVSGAGCNPFEVKRNFDRRETRRAIISGSNVDIVDAPYDPASPFLRGSRQLEGERKEGVRTSVELKWDLRRCGQ